MSETIRCRLCLKYSFEFQRLFDENGVYNMELYTITGKYFDVKFLTDTYENQPSVVCSKCWNIMCGFNNFQHLVNMAHEQLSKTRGKVLHSEELSNDITSGGITVKTEPITDDDYHEPEKPMEYDSSSTVDKKPQKDTRELSSGITIKSEPSTIGYSEMDHNNLNDDKNSISIKQETVMSHDTRTADIVTQKLQTDTDKASSGIMVKSEPITDDYHDEIDHNKVYLDDNSITIKPETLMEYDISTAVAGENLVLPKFRIVHQNHAEEITKNAEAKTGFMTPSKTTCQDDISPRKRQIPTGTHSSSSIHLSHHVAATFSGNSGLSQKNLHLHGRFVKPEKMDEQVSKWKPILLCGLCDKQVSLLSLLQSHFREEHPDERCYIRCCNHNHIGGTEIYQHAAYHNDPKVFGCDICDKYCVSYRALHDHIRYQHSEFKRQNKCNICSRTFKTPSELKEHVDAHKKTENFSSRKMQQKEAFLQQFSKISRRKK